MIIADVIYNFQNSEIVYGKTQSQLSTMVRENKNYNCLMVDFEAFDQTISQDLIVLAFSICEYILALEGHQLYSFRHLRNLFILTSMYHPSIGVVERSSGLSSGSSFTNLIGSLVNFIVTYLSLITYCNRKGINFWNEDIVCRFHGDDSYICTNFKIDEQSLFGIMKTRFGLTVKLEGFSAVGEDRVSFLGSTWIEGQPYRNVEESLLKVLFGSGNLPKMSPKQLFISRGIDIFGNSCDTTDTFQKCGVSLHDIRHCDRLFRSSELYFSHRFFADTMLSRLEGRGEFYRLTSSDPESLNTLWSLR
jgi:hypothetical protein